VRRLYDGHAAAGPTSIEWDGTDARGAAVSSGVYWMRVFAGGRAFERKLVWVR